MGKPKTATVKRIAKSGRFEIRKADGHVELHSAGKKTTKTVIATISKNRDALKRLADR